MKHYPITVDGIVYESTKDLIRKLNLDVLPSSLYIRYTKNKKEFTSEELKEAVAKTKAAFKERTKNCNKNEINLGDLIYNVITTDSNFKRVEEFLLGIPAKGMSNQYFIDYFTTNYAKIKQYLPEAATLDYLLDILHYYFKGETHPTLADLFPAGGKKRLVKGKTLSYYAKQYGLQYNLVYTTYYDTKDLNNPDEAFIKQLEEKHNKLVQRRNKNKNQTVL